MAGIRDDKRLSRFLRSFMLTFLVGILLLAALYRFFGVGGEEEKLDTPELVTQARDALAAVKKRQPGERRPASYDAVLLAIDKLLAKAKSSLESLDYQPVQDFEKVNKPATAARDIAAEARQAAGNELGLAKKEYRFPEQEAEGCYYVALALWNRMEEKRQREHNPGDEKRLPDENETNRLRQEIDRGLALQPDSQNLLYLSGALDRMLGSFAAAATTFKKILAKNPESVSAWNDLGLVSITLKQFDQAEEALEKAREISLKQAEENKNPTGTAYSAALFNLGRFHESLTAFYEREARISTDADVKNKLEKHKSQAIRYLTEYLASPGADANDKDLVKRLLTNLQSKNS